MSASEHCQEEVFDYLMSRCPNLSKSDQIDCLELLGASFANDKEHYNPQKAYAYLNKAMNLRCENNENPIPKRGLKVIKAYGNHQECENLTDLALQQEMPNKLHMEGLAIRERILGWFYLSEG